MYTTAEILKKQELAVDAGLSGVELLDDTERAQRVCNGIGANWMPNRIRALISFLFPTLVLAADIHDIRYDDGGTEEERKFADVEMLDNGIRLAIQKYRLFDPRRYLVQFVMLQFYIKLCKFGNLAWNYKDATDGK